MATAYRRRRGRSVVVSTILSLVGLQLFFTFQINRWRLDLLEPQTGTQLRHLGQRLKEFPQRPFVLTLGTSRSSYGVAADVLSQPSPELPEPPLVFNATMTGGHPLNYLLTLRRLRSIGVKPDGVIIEILPVWMRARLPLDDTDLTLKQVRPADLAMVLNYTEPEKRWERFLNWLELQVAPWYSGRYPMLTRYATKWVAKEHAVALSHWMTVYSPFGWVCHRSHVPEEIATAAREHARKGYQPVLQFEAIHPRYDRILRDLVEYCQQEKIAILGLVTMPEASFFRDWYAPSTRKLIQTYLGDFATAYGVSYVDASEWIDDRWFIDGHHLMEPGASEFSARLRTKVLVPWMRSNVGHAARVPTDWHASRVPHGGVPYVLDPERRDDFSRTPLLKLPSISPE